MIWSKLPGRRLLNLFGCLDDTNLGAEAGTLRSPNVPGTFWGVSTWQSQGWCTANTVHTIPDSCWVNQHVCWLKLNHHLCWLNHSVWCVWCAGNPHGKIDENRHVCGAAHGVPSPILMVDPGTPRPGQVDHRTESDPELRGASGTSGAVPPGARPKRHVAVEKEDVSGVWHRHKAPITGNGLCHLFTSVYGELGDGLWLLWLFYHVLPTLDPQNKPFCMDSGFPTACLAGSMPVSVDLRKSTWVREFIHNKIVDKHGNFHGFCQEFSCLMSIHLDLHSFTQQSEYLMAIDSDTGW